MEVELSGDASWGIGAGLDRLEMGYVKSWKDAEDSGELELDSHWIWEP